MEDVEGQVDEEPPREPLIGMEGRMLEGVDQGPYELGHASEQRRDQSDDSVAPQGTDAEEVAAGAGDTASCGCANGCGVAVMLAGEGAGTDLGKSAAGTV